MILALERRRRGVRSIFIHQIPADLSVCCDRRTQSRNWRGDITCSRAAGGLLFESLAQRVDLDDWKSRDALRWSTCQDWPHSTPGERKFAYSRDCWHAVCWNLCQSLERMVGIPDKCRGERLPPAVLLRVAVIPRRIWTV